MKKKFTQLFTSMKSGRTVFSQAITIASLLLLPYLTMAQTTTLNVGGKTRTIFVYAPSGLAQNRPLIISMHGLGNVINDQKASAKWELVADTAKFLVVYPQGEGNSWDISGNKDTDFISAIIESMVTRYGTDRNRVYVTGFSMGGMMSYHAANKIANKIAAIGPVSGYLFSNPVTSSRPMPIIHVHGMSDNVVYYGSNGGQQGVVATLQKWRTWNQCPSDGTRTTPYPVDKPNSKSVMEYWGPCNNSSVQLLSLYNKYHEHSNDPAGVNTTNELWKFFKKQSLSTGLEITLTSPAVNATFTAPATINLAATASVSGGTISNVRFYNGINLLKQVNMPPFSYSWTNVTSGTYTIHAVATDNQGKTSEATQTIKVNVPQGPYNGTASAIPGIIQAEHFDVGGNGIAYYDKTPGSDLTPVINFRTNEDVDMESCTDAGGGYNIASVSSGEWLEYTVSVSNDGQYSLDLRLASVGAGKTFHVEMNGVNITGPITVPNTNGWQNWSTVTINNLSLTVGQKVMRVVFDSDYINLNYLEFKQSVVTGKVDEAFFGPAIYPNPFRDILSIQAKGRFSYQLMSMSGTLMYEGVGEDFVEINNQHSKGMYLLKVQQGDKTQVVKVVKE
jgi:poly(3-hydroxybutyrate) depolymerase